MTMEKIKITMDKEKGTLLVPLVCRARENEKDRPILSDPMAVQLTRRIDYDF
jgi:O-methyltransferase involved in polyketide biosynthesis